MSTNVDSSALAAQRVSAPGAGFLTFGRQAQTARVLGLTVVTA